MYANTIGSSTGSNFLSRSLLPAPPLASAAATWSVSLPPKRVAIAVMPVALVYLVQAPTGVEQATGGLTAGGGLDLAGVLGVLRVLLQSGEQHRHQRMNRAVDLAFVGA